ncbi:hypothetical protein F5879DRAFT_928037, partial [Lentinula edodes]
MSSPSSNAVTGAPNPVLPPVSSPSHPDLAERIVDAAIDELASTLEEPPLGQLALFKSVFGVVTATIRNPAFWVGLLVSVIFRVHGDPGQRTRFALPSEQWRNIAAKVEASTNSTVALMEINALDEQDQRELDRLELGEFRRQQPQLPRPLTTSSLPSPLPSVVPTPRALAKKRKRSVRQEEGGPSSRKRAVGAAPGSEASPEVHDRKRKCSAGESRDAEVPDYRRVVLVLRPPLVDTSGSAPLSGGRAEEDVHSSPPLGKTGSTRVPPSLSQDCSSGLPVCQRPNSPGSSNQFIPPVLSERRSVVTIQTPPPSQRSPDVLHPFPRARATAALRAENETLRAEVADLRKLLETSRAETSTLTSLLRDTMTSLDDRNKDLEGSRRALQDVAADRLEYSRVLAQFRAIEAELPEAPLEDALTRFHLAVAQVDSYREVAIRQKQELSELREQ